MTYPQAVGQVAQDTAEDETEGKLAADRMGIKMVTAEE